LSLPRGESPDKGEPDILDRLCSRSLKLLSGDGARGGEDKAEEESGRANPSRSLEEVGFTDIVYSLIKM
jgi:hypothetical protein